MLVTTGNLEYKELSVLNKGGEHNSPPTTSNPSSKIYDNNKNASDSSDVVEIFKNVEGETKSTDNSKQTKSKEKIPIDKNEPLTKNLKKLNEKLSNLENTELKFERDKITKRNLIKILDKKTKKVIRQIPPEEFYKFIVELYKINQKNDKLNNGETVYKGDNLKGVFINENI